MNQQTNTEQNNSTSNINCMSTIKTYIEGSSSNFQANMKLFNIDKYFAGKFEIESYKNVVTSREKIRAIYFDKTIFSLIDRQKMFEKEYHYLFYILFFKEIFRTFIIQLSHKNFCKFFKKFYNSCMKSSLFKEQEFAAYIDFYLVLLFQTITGSPNESDISKLQEKPIINLENLDTVNKKYIKFLIKYILAFTNNLDSTKEYKDYQINIFDTFLVIQDTFFSHYFMKQLNKIFLKKGIYSFSDNFIQHILYLIIYKKNKKSVYDFTMSSSHFTNCLLHYDPKYYIDINNKKPLYKNGSPFYFLNLPILINILREMTDDDFLIQNLLFKFIDPFNCKINLFIDDDDKLKIAENILIDTTNKKIIKNHLDIIELIKPYFNINNKNNNVYFDCLFYDLCLEKFITFYFSNSSDKKSEYIIDTSLGLNLSLSQSQDYDFDEFSNISKERTKKDYIDLIINKFNNSDNYFINKYFNTIYDNNNIIKPNMDDFLLKKSIEELLILLDIIYSISIKSYEEQIIKESILDIRRIIKCIITKSFNEKKFNCVIFNFINSIDNKYIPLSSEFDIMTSNTALAIISFVDFIKTYPLFLIFVLNYFPKYNLDISRFFNILKSFMIGYINKDNNNNCVFNSIDENMKYYNHTLQINYLTIIYFIIENILNIYNDNENNIYNYIIKYLPYCLKCQKKQKNPFNLSNYLSKCIYCGEKFLFVNTNLYDYLKNNKNEIKNFIDECIFPVLTIITCNILCKFFEKYENRNKIPMFCYHLYYKIMCEHFMFLNKLKIKIGKNIPFTIDPNCEMNNKEGILEEVIKDFFEKYITEKTKYPFKIIFETIENNEFISFNSYRKTIKHESELAKFKYKI